MPITNPFDAFVGSKKPTGLFPQAEGGRAFAYLLWGDGVHFDADEEPASGRRKVRARGKTGWISEAALDGESLLEFYFIDVGQGDGVLIKTPDFRHVLVDGGFPRKKQPTGKSAADFVDWKFVEDYRSSTIALDAMVASHNDEDHYGGLSDLLDAAQTQDLDATGVTIDAFFHAGVSWWSIDGQRSLGHSEDSHGSSYLLDLLGDRDAALAGLAEDAAPALQGAWRAFIQNVCACRSSDGGNTPFLRVCDATQFVPGFAPGEGETTIHILAPIEHDIGGRPGLLNLGADSQNTNGHSVMLRVDYGRTRTLLTGDLNKAAQQAILAQFEGRRIEFQCDVAKACHHGSDDVSLAFLQAMSASCTVISSGDAEGHDHPRPRIVAASGATGHLTVKNDEILTPLVYSTELARSASLGRLTSIATPGGQVLSEDQLDFTKLNFSVTKAGDLNPSKGSRKAAGAHVVAGLVYGLVNVRTDGETILTATMDEKSTKFSVKTFKARF